MEDALLMQSYLAYCSSQSVQGISKHREGVEEGLARMKSQSVTRLERGLTSSKSVERHLARNMESREL